MSARQLELANVAIRAGRFKDALVALEKRDVVGEKADAGEMDALRAAVMAWLGRDAQARELAHFALRRADCPPFVAAQCYAVLAYLYENAKAVGEAIEHYHKAILFAQKCGESRQACEYELQLLNLLGDVHQPESIAAFMRQVWRSAIRSGDPQKLAHLHLNMAKIEARQGLFSKAHHHVDASRRLLAVEANYWLLGVGYLHSSVMHIFQSDPQAARLDAEEALRLSQVSGHAYTYRGAMGNLTHVYQQLGEFEKAAELLSESLERTGPRDSWRPILLDSYSNLLIETGDLVRAKEVLDEMFSSAVEDGGQSSWERMTYLHTRARLFMRMQLWDETTAESKRAIVVADSFRDRIWGLRFRLLLAEAHTHLGRSAEALRMVEDVEALGSDAGELSLRARFERVRGNLWAEQDPGRGIVHLQRAMRIGRSLTDVSLAKEPSEDLSELLWQGPQEERVRGDRPFAKAYAGGGSADSVTTSLARSSEIGGSEFGGPDRVLDAVDCLFTFAGNGQLLGEEVFNLLASLDGTTAVALVAQACGDGRQVLACAEWDYATARQKAKNPGTATVIPLGQWRDRTYELIVEPKNDIASRSIVAAIRKIVSAALQLEAYRHEEKERAALWPPESITDDSEEVFTSAEMIDIVNTAKRVAPTTLPVLLTGETGTGKEVLARIIHKASPRAGKSFLAFNCTAVPRDMLDSQLFGYRRGAFTGAQESFPGVIRAAAGGTLFLDEVGDLGLDVQPKLLRFLETNEIHPLGEPHPVKVDVRIIAATNANLDRMVGEGRFREDLLYRVNVIRFRLPPLRERREEIPQLVQHFIRRYADEFGKGRPRASEETLEYLLLYAWPGNVRQLANELRRVIALLEPDGWITPAHLSAELRASRRTVPADQRHSDEETVVRLDQPLATALQSIERLMVTRALERCHGRVEDASRLLGISRKGLFLKRRRWGIQKRAPYPP